MADDDDAQHTQHATDSVGPRLREAAPSTDRVEQEDVRVRAERALFGAADPACIGRFALLGPIARGGMGIVYGAYDPKLDRRVALKLLHTERLEDAGTHQRLLDEAKALAKLDHPNVVPVHDVLEVGSQIVIVLELLSGRTLAAWQAERPRTWSELLAAYAAAGRGLAAAHAHGLVHRDFKPLNAIIGDDGRVRVLDFGLAVVATAEAEPEAESVPGAAAGTLLYMAPEQLDGLPATARVDQFAFAVSLYRAAFGSAPFAGTTRRELRESIAAGPREPAGRGSALGSTRSSSRAAAPRWLHAVLRRALAADPSQRFPSMSALLSELERPRGWRRWRLPLAAVAIALAAAAATFAFTPDPRAVCDGGERELVAAWDPARREQLRAHFARLGSPYALRVGEQVLPVLDAYRETWSRQHLAACLAHRRGAVSGAQLDRRMTCLARRRDALAAAVKVLGEIDLPSVSRASETASGLPRLDDCANPEALAAAAELPASDATRRAILDAYRQLSEADALERAGRSDEALLGARALVRRAAALAYPPLEIEALLVAGRVLLFRNAFAEASAPLRRAQELALEHELWPQAVIAAARRLYVDAMQARPLESLLAEAAVLVPMSRGLPPDPLARPLLLNNLGAIHMARGDRPTARAWFLEARAALVALERPALELTNIELNLAMVTSDDAAREEAATSAWRRHREHLGEAHPVTLEAQYALAHFTADPARALEPARRVCDLYRQLHPGLRAQLARCLTYQAFLVELLHRDPTALYREAASLAAPPPAAAGPSLELDPDVVYYGALAAGQLALLRGQPKEAERSFSSTLAAPPPAAWWQQLRDGPGHLGLGQSALAAGHPRQAIPHFERAIAAFAAALSHSENVENRLRLAQSHQLLAAASAASISARPEVARRSKPASPAPPDAAHDRR